MKTKHLASKVSAGIVSAGIIAAVVIQAAPVDARPIVRPRLQPSASWSEIDRKPAFNTNSPAGFYIWRDRDYVYVVSNDRNRSRASHFNGTITVRNGSISNLSGYETEGKDRYSQPASNRVTFALETGNGLDGVRFEVHGGKEIVLNLRSNDQRVEQVYLGQYKVRTVRSPLVIAK